MVTKLPSWYTSISIVSPPVSVPSKKTENSEKTDAQNSSDNDFRDCNILFSIDLSGIHFAGQLNIRVLPDRKGGGVFCCLISIDTAHSKIPFCCSIWFFLTSYWWSWRVSIPRSGRGTSAFPPDETSHSPIFCFLLPFIRQSIQIFPGIFCFSFNFFHLHLLLQYTISCGTGIFPVI